MFTDRWAFNLPISLDPEVNTSAFSEQFNRNGVTIVLELTRDFIVYNISIVTIIPPLPIRNIGRTSFHLTVSYNTHFSVNISATSMCGESTIHLELYYG
jgi:hypothetical protein